jgi:hypothetical protein
VRNCFLNSAIWKKPINIKALPATARLWGVSKSTKFRQFSKKRAVQAVLSQRFEIPFPGNPIHLYQSIRAINPSPYIFLLEILPIFALLIQKFLQLKKERKD